MAKDFATGAEGAREVGISSNDLVNIGQCFFGLAAIVQGKGARDHGIETIVAVRHPKPDEPGKIAVVSPCGICRELIHDYDAKARVIVPDNGRTPKVVKIGELLPNKYRRGNE